MRSARTVEGDAVTDAPLVTVCFPTTGRMTYLERAFDTLASQTYAPLEVLILDNASEGAAPAALAAFAACHPNVRVLRSDERLPMFENFNRGIAAATGRYVVFFHDDDVYDPRFIARMVGLLEAHHTAVFAGGNYDIIDGAGALSRRNRLIGRTELWPGRRFITEVTGRGRSPMSTPGIVFRRSALAVEGFDPALPMNWGDFTMLMRLAERGDVMVDAAPMYSWRVHGANASNVVFSDSIPLRTQVLLAYCDEFLARHPGEAATAGQLRAAVHRTHRTGLVWGWLSAANDGEAAACRALLRQTAGGAPLAAALRLAEVVGLSAKRRRDLLPALRTLAQRAILLRRWLGARRAVVVPDTSVH